MTIDVAIEVIATLWQFDHELHGVTHLRYVLTFYFIWLCREVCTISHIISIIGMVRVTKVTIIVPKAKLPVQGALLGAPTPLLQDRRNLGCVLYVRVHITVLGH